MNIPHLRQEVASGNCVAQAILGICYLDGIDTEVDYKEAFRLLSAAVVRGASRAVVNLARMYSEGLGIPQNVHEAIRLYEMAAAAGDSLARLGRNSRSRRGSEMVLSCRRSGRHRGRWG